MTTGGTAHVVRRAERADRAGHRVVPAPAPARGIPQVTRTIDREVPKGLAVHMILDNYATHKHVDVQAWLASHPRFHPHFTTPTSSSWLNLVERWFRELTDKTLSSGVECPLRPRPHRQDRGIPQRAQRQGQHLHLDRHRRTDPGQGRPRPDRPRKSQSILRHTTSSSRAGSAGSDSAFGASGSTDMVRARARN